MYREDDVYFRESDHHSISSAISIPDDRPAVPVHEGLDSRQIEAIETEKFTNDIKNISDEIRQFNKAATRHERVSFEYRIVIDRIIKEDANQSIISNVPQFSYDVTKISNEIRQFPTPSSNYRSNLVGNSNVLLKLNCLGRNRQNNWRWKPQVNSKTIFIWPKCRRTSSPHRSDARRTSEIIGWVRRFKLLPTQPLFRDIKALHFVKQPANDDDTEANRRIENLRQQARKMLQNPETVVVDSKAS